MVVADSLWLRYPGPESPRAPRELPRDGAAGHAHAADPAAAGPRPATRAVTATGPGPATRTTAAPTAAAVAAAGPGPAARAGKTPTTRTTTAADELPDPRRWTARLAQSALECLHGRRPLQQLVRWTAESVYRDLSRRAVALEEAPAVRPRIRALRVCRVTPGVAEASVVAQVGEVARAVAVRLEADDGRWLCTAFDIAEPSPARRGTRRGAARGAAPGAASNGARGGTKGQRAAQASSNASA
ncbi:Rv3235 family protein [Jiangella sp. DSM 45060]|uniref:Rv3235 family protein n=1 Tax=Jiangella sp. DSM 45060 TaxID=1798224 RepID=UPI0035172C9C